jgi:hypothetical protein
MYAGILHLCYCVGWSSHYRLYCGSLCSYNSCQFGHTICGSWHTTKNFVLVRRLPNLKHSFRFALLSQNIFSWAHSLKRIPAPSEKLLFNFPLLQRMFNLSTATVFSLSHLQCLRLEDWSPLPLAGCLHWQKKLPTLSDLHFKHGNHLYLTLHPSNIIHSPQYF